MGSLFGIGGMNSGSTDMDNGWRRLKERNTSSKTLESV